MDTTLLLQKMAEFISISLDSNRELSNQILAQKKAAMVEELNREKYRVALHKAADALYDSDFLTDETERKTFLRKAAEDPVYVVRTLEKVCEAADVAQIGKPARVAARPKEAEYDPVMDAAFGGSRTGSIIDE